MTARYYEPLLELEAQKKTPGKGSGSSQTLGRVPEPTEQPGGAQNRVY